MAHKTGKDGKFYIDDATGSITEITSDTNNSSIQGTLNMLEDSALGDTESTFLPGLAGASLPVNGFVNSTTDGIWGPLVGKRTSITKTFGFYNGVKYYNGEAFPENVQFSGNVNDLQTWSATLRVDGAVSRTSVAPS